MTNSAENAKNSYQVYLDDPDFDEESCPLKITLTYEGPLSTGTSKEAKKKQRAQRLVIRRLFSDQ